MTSADSGSRKSVGLPVKLQRRAGTGRREANFERMLAESEVHVRADQFALFARLARQHRLAIDL